MRKNNLIFPFLLLSTMIIILCSGLYYFTSQQLLQYSVKSRFKEKELITLQLKTDEIQWKKKNKELIVDNRFFDVKKIVPHKDSTICMGWFDEEEDELELNQKRLVHYQHKSKKNSATFPFFGLLYIEYFTSFTVESYFIPHKKIILSNSCLSETYSHIISPPPELTFFSKS